MQRPIGIFGGTFDPIHFGHLRPALELLEELGLAQLRFIPSAVPPHRAQPCATAEQRLTMVRLATADEPRFVVDDREVRRGGISYTVDTLYQLREALAPAPLCLLVGVDAFLGLGGWHRWEELPELAHIIVMHRPGWQLDEAAPGSTAALELLRLRRVAAFEELLPRRAGGILLQPVSQLAISATAVRQCVRKGRSIRYLLPDAVRDYIAAEGLYSK